MRLFSLARLLGGLVLLSTLGCAVEREATSGERIIVSGASGQLGGMVVEELLARGVDPTDLILVSRTPEGLAAYEQMGASTRFGDFGEPESLPAAYEGGTRMLLISINPVPDRVEYHRNAIDAAVEAGVQHIVYVSSVDVDNPTSASAFDHRSTEEHIRASGVAWTMVRNHLYANGLVNQAARMLEEGSLIFQPDEVPTAFVAREDCAAAAAAVLAGEGHEGRSYDITGPDLLLRTDIADMASEFTGVTIERIEGPGGVEQAPGPMAGFASFDLQSDAVRELIGRPPISVRELLEANVEVLREAAGVAGPQAVAPQAGDRVVDLSGWFQGIDPADATFVVLEAETGAFTRFNPSRASEGFIPASTFKIPNALIALETGVADGAGFTLPWDGVVPEGAFWVDAWSQDHTLHSAMTNSVVWYYRELARRIGLDRMRSHIDRFGYGNGRIGPDVDGFWLAGDFRVSADEQVEFLRRLDAGELGVSEASRDVVWDIIVLEKSDAYRIGGKTGTASPTPTRDLAWLVGYVEAGDRTWYYALNMEGEEVWDRWGAGALRLELVQNLLRDVGVL